MAAEKADGVDMNLPLSLSLSATQTQWSALLNPILANPILSGRLLTVPLILGVTVVNHGLQRNLRGWFVVDQNAQANLYRSQPLNDLTLTLTSDAAVTVTLWVF